MRYAESLLRWKGKAPLLFCVATEIYLSYHLWMTITGRPTLHRPEDDEQAHEHCLLGATNAELADVFAVSPRTIDSWIANIPEFAKAVRDGLPDAVIVADGSHVDSAPTRSPRRGTPLRPRALGLGDPARLPRERGPQSPAVAVDDGPERQVIRTRLNSL